MIETSLIYLQKKNIKRLKKKNLVLYDVEKNKKIFETRDIGFNTKKENYKYLGNSMIYI